MSREREPRGEETPRVLVTPQRRRPRRRRRVYTRPLNVRRAAFTFVILSVCIVAATLLTFQATARYAVRLGDAPLVVLDSREEAERALLEARRAVAPAEPALINFLEGDVHVGPYRGRMRTASHRAALAELNRRLTAYIDGYAIAVNGKPRVILTTKEAAARAIAEMQERGLGDRQGVPTFKERVRIFGMRYVEGKEDGIPLVTPRQAAEMLVHPPKARIHTVTRGDSFWKISNANGITVQELRALNPGVDHTRLREGDQVRLPDEPSPVTVTVVEPAPPRR